MVPVGTENPIAIICFGEDFDELLFVPAAQMQEARQLARFPQRADSVFKCDEAFFGGIIHMEGGVAKSSSAIHDILSTTICAPLKDSFECGHPQ